MWTVDVLYQGPNTYVAHIESSAAIDIELIILHGLGRIPLSISVMAHNSAANAAGYWVDDITDTQVHLHKPNGGAGSFVHLQLSTLRHPH